MSFPPRKWIVGTLLPACALLVLLWVSRASLVHRLQRHTYGLRTDGIDSWQSFGGNWDVEQGVIHNNSDERGAKLVSGDPDWSDYTLQGDLRYDGEQGDMGLVLRSNNEEGGVDAYNGYYAGLRTTDDALVIGRANYGWVEALPITMPGGVLPGVWYRVRVTAVGCQLAASAENLETGGRAWIAFTEPSCVRSGRVGLRSMGVGGAWKNVSVWPAKEIDYEAMARHAGAVELPEFPKREADYNRRSPLLNRVDPVQRPLEVSPISAETVRHISDLQSLPRMQQSNVTLRGVVTLTGSDLYVEDSTGGLVVHDPQGPSLNVGDGVEMVGPTRPMPYSAAMQGGAVRVISRGTPIPPVSVTSWQAASGAYDARFIEIDGHLKTAAFVDQGKQVLNLSEGGQTFRALYRDRPGGVIRDLQKDSYVRLRGVCVVGRNSGQELIPFVVLLRSEDDIQVLAGPPWWTPWHLILLFAGLLVLASLLQILYFRIRQWQARAVTQERERLAHDIHDTMAQSFAGIGYQIQGIRTSVLRNERQTAGQIAEQLGAASMLIRKCHEEASRTIAMLSAPISDTHGDLLQALGGNVRKLAGDAIRMKLAVEGEPIKLDLRVAHALLQIGQEAISNAVAHGSPKLITIRLRYEARSVALVITDDGQGFDYVPSMAGFGILGMQRRAQEVGATLKIVSSAGEGARVCVTAMTQRRYVLDQLLTRVLSRLGLGSAANEM